MKDAAMTKITEAQNTRCGIYTRSFVGMFSTSFHLGSELNEFWEGFNETEKCKLSDPDDKQTRKTTLMNCTVHSSHTTFSLLMTQFF